MSSKRYACMGFVREKVDDQTFHRHLLLIVEADSEVDADHKMKGIMEKLHPPSERFSNYFVMALSTEHPACTVDDIVPHDYEPRSDV